MKIQFFSDLHLEFNPLAIETTQADVVVFAGDIHIGHKALDWFQQQKIYCPIIYVLGNHEYYRHIYQKLIRKLMEATAKTNIHVLENRSIALDGVAFHGATLWTNFELFGDAPSTGYFCQMRMNDYRFIRREPSYSRMRSIDIAMIHKNSMLWLGESLDSSAARINVVVSHHAPSTCSLAANERNEILSAAYASQLEPFIKLHKPDYWIHGHIHHHNDYYIDQCRVVSNPRGYGARSNSAFDLRWIISV